MKELIPLLQIYKLYSKNFNKPVDPSWMVEPGRGEGESNRLLNNGLDMFRDLACEQALCWGHVKLDGHELQLFHCAPAY